MEDCVTDHGVIRIGLAHGAVHNFCEEGNGDGIIAPDRAKQARLDYLALGDWHGRIEIDPRCHYSGTPEPDRFKHETPSTALLVTIEAAGIMPQVETLPTASFRWLKPEITILETDDPLLLLHDRLPSPHQRRQTLMRLRLSGYSRLSMRNRLYQEIEVLKPDFALLELNDTDLTTLYAADDLDAIDHAGILRHVADELLSEAQNETVSKEQRSIASAALTRLYFYAQEASG